MFTDLRNAIRALRAAPGFTVVALVVLTLGIGATTAIFSVVDAVVLRGLPFDEADRLVAVTETNLAAGDTFGSSVAPQNLMDWKARQDVFEGLAASAGGSGFTIRGEGEPENLVATRVTANLFPLLRVAPRIGVAFAEHHEVEGQHRVIVLSDGLWRRRFGADPNVLGKTMTFDNGTWEIVGVMPPEFKYPINGRTELWTPYFVAANERERGPSRSYYLQVFGRLKPGVTIDRARAQMEQINASLAEQYPRWFSDAQGTRTRGLTVMSLHDRLVGRSKAWMFMLLTAVGVVLLIACVNVANLMLARATTRSREVGIRAALGASRWQLARALLAESLVLSVAGTICGIVVAWWGVDVLRAALPTNLPRIAEIAIDLRVLGAAAIAAVGTGMAFGLMPAIQHSRPNLTRALREEGRSGAAGSVRQRLRSALVVAEVVLAVVLLVGSGLFISSFVRLVQTDLGLDVTRVLTVSVYPRIGAADTSSRETQQARWRTTMAELFTRLRQIPNVETVAMISGSGLPLSGSSSSTIIQLPGQPQQSRDSDALYINRVTPEYPAAIGMRLLRGRFVDHNDIAEAPPVVVINDFAARRFLADRDPLGAVLIINSREHTVVGVAANTRRFGPETEVRPEGYFPVAQTTSTGGDFVIKTRGPADALAPAAKAAVRSVLPDMVVPAPQTLEQMYAQLVAQRKFNMLLLGLFGVLAVSIAGAGIYGVMAYLVEQRKAEIGVRLALGAMPGGILRMVLARAALLLGIGLVGGLAAAFAVSRWIQQFLFEVKPHDPVVYISVGTLLVAIGLLAALVPARRASRVDPLAALR